MLIRTQRGYDFFEVASALQKAIRRGDIKLAGYFALELFPQYAEYCWKRLLTISAEDCFPMVTQEVKALYDSFHVVNKGRPKGQPPKGRIFISKAVIILCRCGHNRDADILQNYIYDKKIEATDEVIENYLDKIRQEGVEIPDYVYDIHTRKGRRLGRTKEDFFLEEELALSNKQMSILDYLVLGDNKESK